MEQYTFSLTKNPTTKNLYVFVDVNSVITLSAGSPTTTKTALRNALLAALAAAKIELTNGLEKFMDENKPELGIK